MIKQAVRRDLPAAVKVYPSVQETAKFNLMARRGRLQQLGIRAARLQGAGREFESLRDYQPDDEIRRIDWKATARRGRLVSRQYEVEKSQSVIIAIDTGRTMIAEIDGVQKLDYAINAALLLAYVATLSEDRVGLLLFADSVQKYLPPKKGSRSGVLDHGGVVQYQSDDGGARLPCGNGVFAIPLEKALAHRLFHRSLGRRFVACNNC